MGYGDYLDGEKLIVTVATTGGVHGKDANPNLPEQPEEIAADVRACEELGAAIVHVHGRDEHGENDASRLQQVDDAIRDRCDDIIIQNTTGGQGPLEERIEGIRTDPPPEMASLDLGPFKRDRHIITEHTRRSIDALALEMRDRGIKPELEVFNGGQLNEVFRLIDEGLLDPPYYVNLIFGGRAFTIPRPRNVINMVENLPAESAFNVLATGPHQVPLTTLGILLGGHVRVGLEDNLYYDDGRLAASNAELVERTVEIADRLGREIATPQEARTILGI
ncbi:3-keto-5-aminohexanoate cleavage protein [Natronomonas marina]|jgi:3-keto-5-aminohexanoate cleavage enzyme|uniref:3-keto-5-aminohexanoate cleavage protein n=1 Tax=Natronomonas marina TaxID=2961939 RepID=UPI0020C9C4E8|nr:3-keto-5-aminohexanoate cleavage protein [Natronomonas marina]